MKTGLRLLLFLALLAAMAGGAYYLFHQIFHRSSNAGPVNYHYWIHSQLNLSAKQESELEEIEAKFARHKDQLVASIREANVELSEALLKEKADSLPVKTAVKKIHQAQGELQQAVLDHVFEMRPVLTDEQYDRLIQQTAYALRDPPELR